MAKVFIGIALLLMLATAGVGFMLKGNVDKLQSKVNSANGKIADAEGKAKAAQKDAETAKKDAKEQKDLADAAAEKAAAAAKQADEANNKYKEAQQLVDSSTQKIAALQKELEEKGKTTTPQVEDPRIAELTGKLQNAEKERDEAKVALDAQVAKVKENEQRMADLEKEKKERAAGFTRPGLQGRILAVNAGWNFVVLSVGDRQGVMVNSSLIVVRGSEPIARLRITSVEPTTSIADVLPGTVRKGTSIQPGDTVIFEGTRGASPVPSSKSAPESATPAGSAAPALPNS